MLWLLDAALLLLMLGATYSYFGYPLVLALLARGEAGGEVSERAEPVLPRISVIITAHNEAARIAGKLEECLTADYPADRLEIIVASDASTDETDAIVEGYRERGVLLARAEERLGKEHAQSVAIRAAGGDILVFSDVGTTLRPSAFRDIVQPFADPKVGAVSSEDAFLSQDGSVVGEGLYVRYEMWLRRLESRVRGLVGLSGSFFAARREVCRDWDTRVPSDFNTALNAAELGFISVSAPQARGYYRDVSSPGAEYGRKVRTVLRGIAALAARPEVLDPRRFGLFAWQVWSHKVARWVTPWLLLVLLAASIAAWPYSALARVLLISQAAFYGAAVVGLLLPRAQAIAPVRIALFFTQANQAIVHATMAYMAGKRVTVWSPTRR